MAVLRRYKDLGASQVMSIYGLSGLLERKVKVPQNLVGVTVPEDGFISVFEADNALARLRDNQERERALSRRSVRLPAERATSQWAQLTDDEKRVLLMSQKEYNSFRTAAGLPSNKASKDPAEEAEAKASVPGEQ